MSPILAAALGVYILFLVFFVVHSLFLVYHLVKFSVRPDRAKGLAVTFTVVSGLLLTLALALLSQISWDASLTLPPAGTNGLSRVL